MDNIDIISICPVKSRVCKNLALEIVGKSFTVTTSGKDADTGIAMVALYDSKNLNRLLELKVFELKKGDVIEETFTQNGYVKAYWWTDLETMTPLCEPAYSTIK